MQKLPGELENVKFLLKAAFLYKWKKNKDITRKYRKKSPKRPLKEFAE